MEIIEKEEEERGCGYRKTNGLYLVTEPLKGLWQTCFKLPVLTEKNCLLQSRSFTYIDNKSNVFNLFYKRECKQTKTNTCDPRCTLNKTNLEAYMDKIFLLWIGKSYYPTPKDFIKEAMRLGVSRRIKFIPEDLKLGHSIVAVAHSSVTFPKTGKIKPGIFMAFRPSAIEFIVDRNKLDNKKYIKKLEALEKQGVTLVKSKKILKRKTDIL